MKIVARELTSEVVKAARAFSAVILTGPRRAGKTSLLRRAYPDASYVLLEDPDVLGRVRSDPRGFLTSLKPPVILDEIQNAPELFNYVRTLIDMKPSAKGRWFVTGSQEAPMMQGVTESMAGRAAILQLLPLSLAETDRVTPLIGGFPEVLTRPSARSLWFASYLQTYLERDVRAITQVRDLTTFRRFLAVLATHHGKMLNKTALASPLGISIPTITQWLSVLETTGQVLVIPPYFENLGKRLVKSPKVYIGDSGLACHLLGIDSAAELERSPFLGSIIEGFVASEIVKSQLNGGRRRELYYFRDQQGLEVDFVLPARGHVTRLIEVKAGQTVESRAAGPLQSLATAFGQRRVESLVVHRAGKHPAPTAVVGKDVRAASIATFVRTVLRPGR